MSVCVSRRTKEKENSSFIRAQPWRNTFILASEKQIRWKGNQYQHSTLGGNWGVRWLGTLFRKKKDWCHLGLGFNSLRVDIVCYQKHPNQTTWRKGFSKSIFFFWGGGAYFADPVFAIFTLASRLVSSDVNPIYSKEKNRFITNDPRFHKSQNAPSSFFRLKGIARYWRNPNLVFLHCVNKHTLMFLINGTIWNTFLQQLFAKDIHHKRGCM